ncbi:MAG: hypothetical protein ACI9A7_001991, partial [Cyclobacteriaceae bacterium]
MKQAIMERLFLILKAYFQTCIERWAESSESYT